MTTNKWLQREKERQKRAYLDWYNKAYVYINYRVDSSNKKNERYKIMKFVTLSV